MNACDGTQQRETDRHTCALTCEVVAVTRAEELEPDAMHQALSSISWRDRCYATCAGLSTDDRATCRLTCSDAAVALCGQW